MNHYTGDFVILIAFVGSALVSVYYCLARVSWSYVRREKQLGKHRWLIVLKKFDCFGRSKGEHQFVGDYTVYYTFPEFRRCDTSMEAMLCEMMEKVDFEEAQCGNGVIKPPFPGVVLQALDNVECYLRSIMNQKLSEYNEADNYKSFVDLRIDRLILPTIEDLRDWGKGDITPEVLANRIRKR